MCWGLISSQKFELVVTRAFNISKNKLKSLTKFGDENVSKAEFGYLFYYLRQYANYWYVFDDIDTSKDHQISKN